MRHRLAIAGLLKGYRKAWARADLMSGATVWALIVPTAMAYASMVGVEPIIGLYTVPLALLGYALFGGLRLLVVGPDAAVAVLAGATVASVAAGATGASVLTLVMLLGLSVGAIYVIFALLRLGWIADLIPDPVLKGLIEGMVWVTVLKELPDMFGFHLAGSPQGFFAKLAAFIQGLPDAHGLTTIVGIGSLAALVLLHRFAHRLPGALIVLAATLVAVMVLGLDEQGVAVMGLAEGGLAGMGPRGGIEFGYIVDLLPGALSIVVMGFTITMAAAKGAAAKSGDHIDPDQELLALGASNLFSGFGGGYPVAGTLSKTAAAIEAGGKTQIGNLLAGALGVLTILFLLPLFASLADAMLAALVVFVLAELSDVGYFRRLWGVHRLEFVIALSAFAGVLLFDVMTGVIIGVLLSLVALVDHIHRPPTAVVGRTPAGAFVDLGEGEEAEEIPGMRIWRQYAPLVFLNARRLADELRALALERPDTNVVLLDGSASSGLDSTATTAFLAARDELAAEGIELWVASVWEASWKRIAAMFEQAGTPIPRRFGSLQEAVEAFEKSGDGGAGDD